jgi:hypothetical protein
MASEPDDAAEAAARLEAALERIARLTVPHQAAPPPGQDDPLAPSPPLEEIAARLDALIDRLRAALGQD